MERAGEQLLALWLVVDAFAQPAPPSMAATKTQPGFFEAVGDAQAGDDEIVYSGSIVQQTHQRL
ncbi:hypothetical protein [Mycolicibacterium mengxianglii]|uniref:hypothetical protein n=1 Tax=Mycolicibacterium mengxianglii TaxID=2736649 RepID=UPI0018EF25FC|nr:hypothetical protein [Mycolicibacterium mengxianglii]